MLNSTFKKRLYLAWDEHLYRYYALDERGYRVRVRLVAVLAVLSLATLAALILSAGYRRHEETARLAAAQELVTAGDYAHASENATAALEMNPSNAAACLVMAEVALGTHSLEELKWRERMVALAPTIENKLSLADAGLRCQAAPYPVTTRMLGELAAGAAGNAAYHETAAALAARLQHAAEAEAHYQTACQLAPSNHEYALNLALFELRAAPREGKPAWRRQIEQLAADDQLKPVALRALVADLVAAGDGPAALPYSTQLLATARAGLADQLQNLEILQATDPAAFTNQLRTLETGGVDQGQSVAIISDWMRMHGLVAENIRWLSRLPAGARARQSVQMALAQSYLRINDWHSLLDFTSQSDWEDMDFLRLAMISHACSQLDMTQLAESNWSQSVHKASDRYEAMTNLLALADEWHLKLEADDLRQRLRQFGR